MHSVLRVEAGGAAVYSPYMPSLPYADVKVDEAALQVRREGVRGEGYMGHVHVCNCACVPLRFHPPRLRSKGGDILHESTPTLKPRTFPFTNG